MKSTVCTIKPFNGTLRVGDKNIVTFNDLIKKFKYDPTSKDTYDLQLKKYFANEVQYAYGVEAMLYMYQSEFWTFLGENPIDLDEGIAWQNISSYPFTSRAMLINVVSNNISRAIDNVNNKLAESQSSWAGIMVGDVSITSFDQINRELTFSVTIAFDQQAITETMNLNMAIKHETKNNKNLIKLMRKAA